MRSIPCFHEDHDTCSGWATEDTDPTSPTCYACDCHCHPWMALNRVGVTFSAEQEQRIRVFQTVQLSKRVVEVHIEAGNYTAYGEVEAEEGTLRWASVAIVEMLRYPVKHDAERLQEAMDERKDLLGQAES